MAQYYNYANLYSQCQVGQTFIDNRKFTLPLIEEVKENYVICDIPAPCSNTNNTCTQPNSYTPAMATQSVNTADPKIWGPNLWRYLHYSSMNYPEKPTAHQSKAMKEFLCNLTVTIPCKKCSMHYDNYIKKHKNQLDNICKNKNQLIKFLIDCHNQVNIRNGKKVLSYEDAMKLYS